MGELLLDYYNGVLDEEAAENVEDHLFVCFSCQDKLLRLDFICEVLKTAVDRNRFQTAGH